VRHYNLEVFQKSKLKTLANDSSQLKNIDNWVSPSDTDRNVDWNKATKWKVTSEGERGFVRGGARG
jgi:hypothetical protein